MLQPATRTAPKQPVRNRSGTATHTWRAGAEAKQSGERDRGAGEHHGGRGLARAQHAKAQRAGDGAHAERGHEEAEALGPQAKDLRARSGT